MEIEMNAKQAAGLAQLIAKHPDRPVTLRQLRSKERLLAEIGMDATILPAILPANDAAQEGGDAA